MLCAPDLIFTMVSIAWEAQSASTPLGYCPERHGDGGQTTDQSLLGAHGGGVAFSTDSV
jgi:hypothetical protein